MSFVVPHITCPSAGDFGMLPGEVVDGDSAYLGAGILLECVAGKASYQAVGFFDGPFSVLNITVHSGDTIISSVSASSDSVATIDDTTTKVSDSDSFAGLGDVYAINVGIDDEYDDYTQLGVPSFADVEFSSATVKKKSLGSLDPTGYSMGNGTTTLIQTSALDPGGEGFLTQGEFNQEPTLVQARVIEGVTGQETLSATVWPATFTSTVSSSRAAYTAEIYWGDGTESAGTVSSAATWNCTYDPLPFSGHCFAVTGRHVYSAAGDYSTYVEVDDSGGLAYADGVAEIVNATPTEPATDSIGVLTWTTASGTTTMCTATVLAGLDLVLTANHCFENSSGSPNLNQNPNFEFGVMQAGGNCGGGDRSPILSIAQCEAEGAGVFPYGYWTGTGIFPATDSEPAAGADTTFISLDDTSSEGYSLVGSVSGLPVHFLAPHGKWTFSTYGYPGRVGGWNLESCLNEKDLSGSSYTVLGIAPCDYNYSNGMAYGTSGSPFISSNLLPDAVAGTMWFVCPPSSGGCSHNGGYVWPQPTSQNTAVANYLSNTSMQAYVAAAYAYGFA